MSAADDQIRNTDTESATAATVSRQPADRPHLVTRPALGGPWKRHFANTGAAFVWVAATVALAGCGSSGNSTPTLTPTATTSTGVTSPTASASSTNAGGTGTVGASANMTLLTGYTFRVSLNTPGVTKVATFTTDDSSGSSGTTLDAPPGQTLIIGTVTLINKTDRPEPLQIVGIGPLPQAIGSSLSLAVPASDASAFGLSAQTNCAAVFAPAGFCTLGSPALGAFSPAQTDITQPPQLAPGASGTVTLISGSPVDGTTVIPEGAPVGDVKLFVNTTGNCATSTSSCWAPLN